MLKNAAAFASWRNELLAISTQNKTSGIYRDTFTLIYLSTFSAYLQDGCRQRARRQSGSRSRSSCAEIADASTLAEVCSAETGRHGAYCETLS